MKKIFSAEQDLPDFVFRHVGPSAEETLAMLKELNIGDLEELTSKVVPSHLRMKDSLELPEPIDERECLKELGRLASLNKVCRSLIGAGYYGTQTPSVIRRNILENPGWYTAYTPYQAEISQGRLEALLNFQTAVSDLTGFPVANASLLDEATAAAEAMSFAFSLKGNATKNVFFVSENVWPQTIAVVETRAKPLGIRVEVGGIDQFDANPACFAVLVQNPDSRGQVRDYTKVFEKVHALDALAIVACDLLSLCLTKTPAEMGADVAVGSSQRFGVPMGFGGPHAAFFSTKDEFKRRIPGRIVGVSKDAQGNHAYRLALQTREQHIRREKATSNICTAQVLLAVMASMYAVYHGPEGLKRIANKVHALTVELAALLRRRGIEVSGFSVFDTLEISLSPKEKDEVLKAARKAGWLFRSFSTDQKLYLSLDEMVEESDLHSIVACFPKGNSRAQTDDSGKDLKISAELLRKSSFLTHPVFHSHHSETEMMRYIQSLQAKDLSLTHSMIPLGSCTMKLNSAIEMLGITMPGFSDLHPFAPAEDRRGYDELTSTLEEYLCEITGFHAASLQPNAGSQGEYAGLLVIHRYHESRGQGDRNICLIPKSAHGTNPASAALAGYQVVVVDCDRNGNVDIEDLKKKCESHRDKISALMVTYPSTHGVFEPGIDQICKIVHEVGGQVYLDGANLNAQVGLCRPGDYGADVCHLNLHKTFCIPHGGGGPGVGPIAVAKHLKDFLPGHPLVREVGGKDSIGAISAAPWGSANILPISWAYIRLMGAEGLKVATQMAILNANYLAKRLEAHYPILYKGDKGLVAHECIGDVRAIKERTGIDVEDIAKRLMDYGFHAPTISFPVAGTVMIEPTESESKAEIDRFCDAMISIRDEIRKIERGEFDRLKNPIKNAPHTLFVATANQWDYPYSREEAVFPKAWIKHGKFWPSVARIDNVLGDRMLVCSCPPIEDYQS